MTGPNLPTGRQRLEGRSLFGGDVAGYDRGRLAYPERVFEILEERVGVTADSHVLEIGAGSGRVTRRLLAMGANVVAVEPDEAFAGHLRTSIPALDVREATFEAADLSAGTFDAVVAATAFHWVDQEVGLPKLAAVLRLGGRVALWWEKVGEPEDYESGFFDATSHLMPPPGDVPDGRPAFQLDVEGWRGQLASVGIGDFEAEIIRRSVPLDARSLRALYATMSIFLRLPPAEREESLDAIAAIVDADFGGVVEIPAIAGVYTGTKG